MVTKFQSLVVKGVILPFLGWNFVSWKRKTRQILYLVFGLSKNIYAKIGVYIRPIPYDYLNKLDTIFIPIFL